VLEKGQRGALFTGLKQQCHQPERGGFVIRMQGVQASRQGEGGGAIARIAPLAEHAFQHGGSTV
jgi:hypothetical protein